MRQGSKMARPHNGMRNGISLVEMLIAIVLFGLITVIGYNYYKNYYDTTFAAKQARIYAIIDQATQLSNAHDIYTIKNGYVPTDIKVMVDERILLQKPDSQKGITVDDGNASNYTLGWQLVSDVNVSNTDSTGIVFTMKLNSTLATVQDTVDYCNILNNTANAPDNNLTVKDSELVASLLEDGYADYNTSMFCYRALPATDNNLTLVFVKRK